MTSFAYITELWKVIVLSCTALTSSKTSCE